MFDEKISGEADDVIEAEETDTIDKNVESLVEVDDDVDVDDVIRPDQQQGNYFYS